MFLLLSVVTLRLVCSHVSDMIFELNKGDTPDMDFSETNVVDIIGETNLQLRTAIDDNNDAAGIKFTYMNVIIKVFNI